jgi:hypothetical protein
LIFKTLFGKKRERRRKNAKKTNRRVKTIIFYSRKGGARIIIFSHALKTDFRKYQGENSKQKRTLFFFLITQLRSTEEALESKHRKEEEGNQKKEGVALVWILSKGCKGNT